MRFQKFTSLVLCALVALAGFSLEVQAGVKPPVKGNPFAGLSAIQQPTSTAVYYGVKNESPTAGELVVGPQVIQVDFRPDGSWTHTPVFTGELKTTFVSLGIQAGAIFVTTLEGEVILASMATGESVAYNGLTAGVRYGLLFADSTMSEIGVCNPLTRQIHYLNLGAARYVRTEQPESIVTIGSSIVMGLLGANAWDVVFRSSSGSTRRYLVSCSGSEYTPVSAPSLRQLSYDYSTSAATTTVIKTGDFGQRWFGISYDGTNVYINTKAGGLVKINVSSAVLTTLAATGVSEANFAADNAVRVESGVPQVYCLSEYAYLKKVNGNTGAIIALPALADGVHGRAIVIDGNSGLAFTAIGYIAGVNSVAVYKCSFSGTGYTTYAKHTVALPFGSFYNWFGVARTRNNDFAVIDNASGRVIRVNSPAGPWSDIANPTGGQNMSIIFDNMGTGTSHDDKYIATDFSQGGGSLNLIDRP